MIDSSPEKMKKKRRIVVVGASELQKLMYDEEKLKKSQDFIEKVKQDKMESLKQFEIEMSLRTQINQTKVERIKRQLEVLQVKEKTIKRESFEKTLADIKKREDERVKNAEQWKKSYKQYKDKKPLFVIKEEIFQTQVDLETKRNMESIERRAEIFKPPPDYLFTEWNQNMFKKKEELMKNLKTKRMEEIKKLNLNQSFSFYHGKFHDIIEKEEALSQSLTNIRTTIIKEMSKRKTDYVNKMKKQIRIKTKKYVPEYVNREPKPTELRVKRVKNHQLHSQKEINELGNKLMKDATKYIRKGSPREKRSMSPSNGNANKSMPIRGRDNSLPSIYRSTPELTIPKKIEYLKEIKVQNKDKKKKDEIDDVLEKNIPSPEKFRIVKAKIEKFENHAKMIENKIKFAKDKSQAEVDKDSLDNYYLNTIKAKIAILNGFNHS